jgi:hypothetical protein
MWRKRRKCARVPGLAKGKRGRHWPVPGTCHELTGRGLVTTGGMGFAAPLARERTGAAARRQVRRPEQARTGRPPQRPRELATRRRPAATSTRATRTSRPDREKIKRWHLRGPGRSALPEPPARTMGVSRNLSRAPTASFGSATPPLDRTPSDGCLRREVLYELPVRAAPYEVLYDRPVRGSLYEVLCCSFLYELLRMSFCMSVPYELLYERPV